MLLPASFGHALFAMKKHAPPQKKLRYPPSKVLVAPKVLLPPLQLASLLGRVVVPGWQGRHAQRSLKLLLCTAL